jgi:hypothetical protein
VSWRTFARPFLIFPRQMTKHTKEEKAELIVQNWIKSLLVEVPFEGFTIVKLNVPKAKDTVSKLKADIEQMEKEHDNG